MKRILVPVDGSAQGLAAVKAAIAEGRGAVERVDLVHVSPVLTRHVSRFVPKSDRDGWREARAKSMGISVDQLEEAYRQRNTLKVSIYPEDIAEAILFFASDRTSKTTGGVLNVDGGVTAAYVR